jgi:hypothetical protein
MTEKCKKMAELMDHDQQWNQMPVSYRHAREIKGGVQRGARQGPFGALPTGCNMEVGELRQDASERDS